MPEIAIGTTCLLLTPRAFADAGCYCRRWVFLLTPGVIADVKCCCWRRGLLLLPSVIADDGDYCGRRIVADAGGFCWRRRLLLTPCTMKSDCIAMLDKVWLCSESWFMIVSRFKHVFIHDSSTPVHSTGISCWNRGAIPLLVLAKVYIRGCTPFNNNNDYAPLNYPAQNFP